MGLNNTPLSERIHIGIFGRRNAGKSSVINAMTGQNLAIVSDVAGTTTDPVQKAMELLPLGPVVMIDTPGLDDVGDLGKMRVERAYQVLQKTDISVLKERIAALAPKGEKERRIIGDLLEPNDFVVLVVPIDSAAPKGRLILPLQQTIRDILEAGANAIVVRDSELQETLVSLGKRPRLVITDSQIFGKVSKIVPEDIPLTSFSILMARYKGNLEQNVKGARALEQLKNGDTVLISEGCTHHRQCEDIGTVKLPRWIREYTGKELQFQFTSGGTFPADLSPYALIVHCGGCMLNEKEMQHRLSIAKEQSAKMTNYGICIAYIHGILERSLAPLGL